MVNVRRAKKSAVGSPQRVEASLVRFSATDIKMMLGVLVVLITGGTYIVKSTVQSAVTDLQLTLAKTYVTKDDFKSASDNVSRRLDDVHQDVSRMVEAQRVKK